MLTPTRSSLVVALLFMSTACQDGVALQVRVPRSDSTIEVVVANQGSASASILNADGTTMKHVTVGNGPHEAAVSPNGRIAVVTIYGQGTPGNQLAVIDLVGDTVVRTIDLGQYTRPHGAVFLAGSNDRVAVTSEATSNIVVVNLSSGAIEAVPTNARASHMVAVRADGARAWTTNVTDNSVSELDLAGKRFVRSFTVPASPEGIAVTPDGAEVWVGSNATGAVTVINTATGQIAHTLTGAQFPYRLGASPDGRVMAIVDGRGNQLLVADVATHRITGSIGLNGPRGVTISADNRTAYVTQGSGALAVVDLVQLNLLRSIPVQVSPDGVGAGIRR